MDMDPESMHKSEEDDGIGCVSFFTRRIVLPALLLLLGGCVMLIPAFLLMDKPTIGPTLVVVAIGLIFMSIILMYSELRRLRMERARLNGTQEVTTGAADFLRGGRPDPPAQPAPLNPYHPADPRYEEFKQQHQQLKASPSI